MSGISDAGLAEQIGACLPYLRRYARALTGRQQSGDTFAAATLEAILADPSLFEKDKDPKVSLFRAFHAIWASTGSPVDPAAADTGLERQAQAKLAKLTPNTREVLLLHTIEEFALADIAKIMKMDEDEASDLLDIAYDEMAKSSSGRILVIEDEAIIAMDLESMMVELGHQVVGIARTETGGRALARHGNLDKIL
jgi:DNA-directed RNA polymerase specialized sigma24 family protein